MDSGGLLIDGGDAGWSNSWSVVVDGVMGGQSSGFLGFSDDVPQKLEFTGVVSLDGGGFSEVRLPALPRLRHLLC